MGCRGTLWVCRLSRHCGWLEAVARPPARCCASTLGAVHRLQEEVVEVQLRRTARARRRPAGRPASARRPVVSTSSAPAFGLTQTQSIPAGAGSVPLVSIAISKPRACSASTSASSSCSSGSPPVHTTKRSRRVGRRRPRRPRRRRPARRRSANLPPPGPSVPTKSVSQNWQTAVARSRLAPGPQVAAGEPAEHRRPAGVGALALERVEDLLDGVAHATACAPGVRGRVGHAGLARSPCSRSRQASQCPHAAPVGVRVVAADGQRVVDAQLDARADDLRPWSAAISGVWMRSGCRPRRRPWSRGWPSRSNAAMYSGRQSG